MVMPSEVDYEANASQGLVSQRQLQVLPDPNVSRPKCCSGPSDLSRWMAVMLLIFYLLLGAGVVLAHPLLVAVIVVWGFLVSLALHEYGHAIVAYYGGDTGVVDEGYLTLDILRYADPIMTFLIPTLLLVFGGFALPGGAVMIMSSRMRDRKWGSAVSLAGPVANFLFACILGLTLQALLQSPVPTIASIFPALSQLCYYQVMATVLSLIPLPPLDGWFAISAWLPEDFFLKRLMWNPLFAKGITIITILLLFLATQYLFYLKWLISTIAGLLGAHPSFKGSLLPVFAPPHTNITHY